MNYAADIGDELTDLLGTVINVAVKVLILLLIVGLGWLIAKWIRRWLRAGLQRIGLDRVVERGGVDRMLGQNRASDLAARIVVFVFMLFVLQLAFNIFGPNPVSDLIGDVIAWLPRLLVAVIIVVVAAAIAGWLREIIAGALGGLPFGRAVAIGVQVLVLVLGGIAALSQIGVATSVTVPLLVAALATVAGVIIVGVGGGLVRPMQQRWERMLTRAEAEGSAARHTLRGQRAERAATASSAFGQPAYSGGPTAAMDEKQPPADSTTETTDDLTIQPPSAEPR